MVIEGLYKLIQKKFAKEYANQFDMVSSNLGILKLHYFYSELERLQVMYDIIIKTLFEYTYRARYFILY